MDKRVLFGAVLLCAILAIAKDVAANMEDCVATDYWAIELAEGTDPTEIADRHGHDLLGKFEPLPGIFIFQKKPDTIHGITHPHHNSSMDITWCENQVARNRSKRDWVAPSDPMYSTQWHLHQTPSTSVHSNLEGAWRQGVTGEGVTIAIVDDGLERNHPDLAPNYRADSSYDFNFNDPDPYPDTVYDSHGTSCAGAAAGRDDGFVCGIGTAFRAKVAGIRILSASTTDLQESSALSYRNDINDIYSCSWGPYDDGRRLEGPGRLAAAAIEHGINNGRQGKGSLFVWAAGNGRGSEDNCNYDGWSNSRFTMTVAAVDTNGNQAGYSESCSMILVTCPSSGGATGISSTDLLGYRGKDASDCTTSFGGTSAAAPQVAGIVALIIQKNPNLGWRDVQAVLLSTAKKNAVNDDSWHLNGAGHWVSHKYGFGLVDASAAVELASRWTNLPSPQRFTSVRVPDDHVIPEGSFYESKVQVNENFVVEHVVIKVVANHPWRGECRIEIISPSGTVSVLQETHFDINANIDWSYGSIFQWGEQSAGTWTFRITDGVSGNTRRNNNLVSWGLDIYGH